MEDKKKFHQLSIDYYFWKYRYFYKEMIEKFLIDEISITDFYYTMLYALTGDRSAALDLYYNNKLMDDHDLKSFKFSNTLLGLLSTVEGFDVENVNYEDDDPIITEEQFREGVSITLKKINEYLMNKN